MFTNNKSVNERYESTLEKKFSKHGGQYKIINSIGENKNVLDIGCATGYLSKELLKKGCFVVGIELDPDAANIAKGNCSSVIIGDIERMVSLPYSEAFFDFIICGDILEHVVRPDMVLLMIRKYLKKSGLLIAAIPNIGYISARLKVLLGKFDYEEVGHFDKTHLRFFTLRTSRELIKNAGYEILRIDYSGPSSIVQILPTWLAIKSIIFARPK